MGLLEDIIDSIFPHTETGKGLRPQSDVALQQVITALKSGGRGATAVKAAMQSPKTVAVNYGDPGLLNPFRLLNSILLSSRGAASAATTHPTAQGSEIFLNPSGAAALNKDIPNNILPHELLHALRINQGTDTSNLNIEESLGRMAGGEPLNTYLYRQFASPGILDWLGLGQRTPNPTTVDDTQRLQQMLQEAFSGG